MSSPRTHQTPVAAKPHGGGSLANPFRARPWLIWSSNRCYTTARTNVLDCWWNLTNGGGTDALLSARIRYVVAASTSDSQQNRPQLRPIVRRADPTCGGEAHALLLTTTWQREPGISLRRRSSLCSKLLCGRQLLRVRQPALGRGSTGRLRGSLLSPQSRVKGEGRVAPRFPNPATPATSTMHGRVGCEGIELTSLVHMPDRDGPSRLTAESMAGGRKVAATLGTRRSLFAELTCGPARKRASVDVGDCPVGSGCQRPPVSWAARTCEGNRRWAELEGVGPIGFLFFSFILLFFFWFIFFSFESLVWIWILLWVSFE
jgi:hypothetical protein